MEGFWGVEEGREGGVRVEGGGWRGWRGRGGNGEVKG